MILEINIGDLLQTVLVYLLSGYHVPVWSRYEGHMSCGKSEAMGTLTRCCTRYNLFVELFGSICRN